MITNSNLAEPIKDDFFSMFELDHDDKKEDELEEYLRKPVVAFRTDPLQWWKVKYILNLITNS